MEKLQYEQMLKVVKGDIEKKQLARDVEFFKDIELEENFVSKDKLMASEEFDIEHLKTEISFMQTHWNVSLDYSIKSENKIQLFLKNILKKFRGIVLLKFANDQNEINYSNKQVAMCIGIYMEQMQKKMELLMQKQRMMEKEIELLNRALGKGPEEDNRNEYLSDITNNGTR